MHDIDCQEFHELMMDYRGATPQHAPDAYQRVLDYINERLNAAKEQS